MKGFINELKEIYSNLDADKQNKLDKLFQEVYNMGVKEGYNKQIIEEYIEEIEGSVLMIIIMGLINIYYTNKFGTIEN